MNSNMDWSSPNRASYGSPIFLMPSPTMFNGLQQMASFVPGPVAGQTDQMGSYPAISPGVGPNLNGMVPGSYPTWSYWVNWNDNSQTFPQTENASPMQYHTSTYIDPASLAAYPYGSLVSPLPSLSLPYQMVKTPTGYMLQDMEALTQQEPAIPRAVPSLWTNPSELTLAKCLENREGIMNVYIRGFLPETTDEMLHAYASRFGTIERCKAIVDLDSGRCKGLVFLVFSNILCPF